MTKISFLRHMLTGSACALILAGAAAAQTRNFDVPSGDLQGALDAYARQASVQLVYRTEDVRGVRTRGVREAVDAETALRRLLEGTGLTVQRDSSGALAIVRQPVQKTTANDDHASTVDEVVVTGSRLKNVFDAATPVVSMEREALLEGGYMDLAEALTDIPGVEEGSSLANNQSATQANGLSTISLRNLGENRTLTLIDGHRTVSNAGNRNAVSLSSIPEFFVDRVEVTTGGGSAVYGSDAIAGVVNIITERNLNGVRARIVGGTTHDGGGDSIEYSVGAGGRFLDDRLYVMAGATYDRQFKLKATDRQRALQSILYMPASNTVVTPDRSTSIAGGRFVSGRWFYDDSGLRPNMVTAVDGYEDRPEGTLITPRDNLNGAVKFDYAVTDGIKLWGQLLYSNVVTDSTRAPTTFSNTTSFGVNDEFTLGRMSRTLNPFAPAEIKAAASSSGIDFRRRVVEVGPNLIHNERETIRSWVGIEGSLPNDWDWKLTYGYGKFSGEQIRGNTLNLQRVQWALDSERVNGVVQCRSAAARADGCVPLNIFGVGSITPEMANYIRANTFYRPTNRQDTIEGYVSGALFELPAGPVETAFGFESRRDHTQTRTDPLIQSGVASSSFLPEYEGTIKANEVFAEASVPLLADLPFAHRLVLNGAVRVADYNLEAVGTTVSYRAGLQWSPISDLRLRTEYARAQRAPDTSELFSPPRDDADTVADICSGVTAGTAGVVAQNCRADSRIAAAIAAAPDGTFRQLNTQIKAPNAGNPNLFEETADTLTVGLVYRPSYLPGFEASVDYYDIKISDVIASLSNSALLLGCYSDASGADNVFCDTITRDEDGQLARILNQEQNLNETRARGVDVAASYRFDLEQWKVPGTFRASVNYSRRLELSTEYDSIDKVELVETVGEVGTAKNEARFGLSWYDDAWSVRWSSRFIGEVVDSLERQQQAVAAGWADPLYLYLDEYWRHDLSVSFKPNINNSNLKIFGTVKNIFNDYGPFLPDGTESGNAYNYSSAYGVIGRAFTLGVQVEF